MTTTHPRFRSATLVLALVAAGTAGGGAVQMFNQQAHAAVPVAAAASASGAGAIAAPDFSSITQAYGPAVVNITVSGTRKTALAAGEGADPFELFRRGVPGMPGVPGNPRGEVPMRGAGSGFIVSADGLILTNAHVVDGADEVTVKLTDRREFAAKVLGADPRTDVAVLKIKASDLPVVKLGQADTLRVGQWVLAIGSPFGLENSVTAGIVSAKQRDTGDYLPFIQTDVAINPGNSGGPLINMRGEVIGINSQIYSRSGGFMGISFAIPIDEAIRVAEQLRSTGRVTRGRIGVQIDQVSKDVAESLGLPRAQGALVRSVESGSPADKAGLEAGDIILKFAGRDIERPTDLPRLVGNTKPGTRAPITIFRRGDTRDLQVQVAQLEPEQPQQRASSSDAKPKGSAITQSIGLAVADLTDAQKRELKIKGGVRVEAVADAAARAGIRENDVIVAIGNTEINNVREFEAAVSKADKSKPIPVLLRRGELATYLLIRPQK